MFQERHTLDPTNPFKIAAEIKALVIVLIENIEHLIWMNSNI